MFFVELVKKKFEAAKELLKAWGYEPVSPLDNGCTSTDWAEQMMACLPMLLSCGGVYMLDNWMDSDGAKIELFFAEKRGLYILEEARQGFFY